MWTGKLIQTNQHANGIFIHVGILACIGDLLAMCKAIGFAGVAAHHFCSFCKLQHNDLSNLDYLSWEAKNGPEVLAAAKD